MAEQATAAKAAGGRALSRPVIGPRPLWDQFHRIGGDLTPQRVGVIIREADYGNPQRLVDAFHEFRQKDGSFHSVCQNFELSVSSLPWSLSASSGAGATSRRAAEFLTEHLKVIEAELKSLVAHLVGEGTAFGYSYAETMWTMGRVKNRSMLVPSKWNRISCRRFRFRQVDGELVFAPTPSEPADSCHPLGEVLPRAKLVEYRPRVNGDTPIREGMARASVWYALFRNWALKDWMLLGEVGWKPYKKGSYKKGAAEEDIEILKTAILEPGESGSAMPDTVTLDIEWPKGQSGTAGGTHLELMRFLGEEIVKAWLGQTLTADAGKNGSRSLGEVHERQLVKLIEARAGEIAGVIQKAIIEPMVALNFGENVQPPIFSFNTENGIDISSLSTAVKQFREAGLRVPAQWVRERAGMPNPTADEELVGDSVDENGKRVVSEQPQGSSGNGAVSPADNGASQDAQAADAAPKGNSDG